MFKKAFLSIGLFQIRFEVAGDVNLQVHLTVCVRTHIHSSLVPVVVTRGLVAFNFPPVTDLVLSK